MSGKSRAKSKDETRQALLQAGLQELVENGLKTPSLDAICARAGYTRGAFYVHFEDREVFNASVMEWVIKSFFDLIVTNDEKGEDLEQSIDRFAAALAEGSLPVHATRVVDEILEAGSHSPDVKRRFTDLHLELLARLSKAVLRGQESGTLRGDLPTESVSRLLLAMAMGVLLFNDAGIPLDYSALADTAKRLMHP